MIKDITISNFKGIKEGKLEDLAQINLLVGQNNSGKSTVLESLVLARGFLKFEDRLGKNCWHDVLGHRVERPAPDFRELWHKLNNDNPIAIKLNLTRQDYFSILMDKDYQIEIKGMSEQGEYGKNGRWESRAIFQSSSKNFEKFGKEQEHFISELLFIDPVYLKHLQEIENQIWKHLIPERRDKNITRILNEIFNLDAESISFAPYDGKYKLYVNFSSYAVPVDSLGEGARYALAILSTAALLNKTAFLIEELECHQHTESLKLLVRALFKIARENHLQLFLSTQSIELINYALENAEKERIELKIYHLILNKEGILNARGIRAPDAKVLVDVGPDIRKLSQYILPE